MASLRVLTIRNMYILGAWLIMNLAVFTSAANPFIHVLNPAISPSFSEALTSRYFSVPVTDVRGRIHQMIVSTVSIGSWFATTRTQCARTPNQHPSCGFDQTTLYNPTGASVNGSYCSVGVKVPPQYVECYDVMPNYVFSIGSNTTQNPSIALVASMGLLTNITWNGSGQGGMLGLAAPINTTSMGPWNSVLDDMSSRYAQPRQFSLALNRDPNNGGFLTFGSTLPPGAHSLEDPCLFKTPMLDTTLGGRVNNLYVVDASVGIRGGPESTVQYLIDSGDVWLRVPEASAVAINSAWNPPAIPINDGTGRFSVQCSAQAPAINVVISGHNFNIDVADLLWNSGGKCLSRVVSSQNGLYLLGHPFLVNVIMTFNLDNHMIYVQEEGCSPAISAATISTVAIAGTTTLAGITTNNPSPATTKISSATVISASLPPPASSSTRSSSSSVITNVPTQPSNPPPSSPAHSSGVSVSGVVVTTTLLSITFVTPAPVTATRIT